MATSVLELDYPDGELLFQPLTETAVGLGQEAQSEPQTAFSAITRWWFSGMTKVPENISDVIAKRFQEIPHMKAILMGRSGDVYHVWAMIDEWTLAARKVVYAAQKELLVKLRGFEIDFYVVELDKGAKPEDLVSAIPVIFQRAT